MLFFLSVTVSTMEQGFEVRLAGLNKLYAVSKISNSIIKVHEPSMHKPPVKIIESIVRFKLNGFLELG